MTQSDDRERRIAEVLYDQLTGRHTGDPHGENAVLRPVNLGPRESWTKRDEEVYSLIREAMHLGYDVIYPVGDRWGLAVRLAKMVTEVENEAGGREERSAAGDHRAGS